MNGYEELMPKCEEKDCEHWVDGHCNDNGEVHCPNKPIKVDPEIKWREDLLRTLDLMSNIMATHNDVLKDLNERVIKLEQKEE